MAEIVLFHHALGLTGGVTDFAEQLRRDGHTVHTPDLFEGATFDTLEAGVAHLKEIGFGTTAERGVAAVADLPAELVYAGFSVGVVPAQQLAQTRPGARGALFYYSCLPTAEFGDGGWPAGVPVQVHGMSEDSFFAEDGDLDAARALVASTAAAELFLYPGNGHLFAEPSLPSYDPTAAALLLDRTREFLRDLPA
jgi:dienelactone hydrolase